MNVCMYACCMSVLFLLHAGASSRRIRSAWQRQPDRDLFMTCMYVILMFLKTKKTPPAEDATCARPCEKNTVPTINMQMHQLPPLQLLCKLNEQWATIIVSSVSRALRAPPNQAPCHFVQAKTRRRAPGMLATSAGPTLFAPQFQASRLPISTQTCEHDIAQYDRFRTLSGVQRPLLKGVKGRQVANCINMRVGVAQPIGKSLNRQQWWPELHTPRTRRPMNTARDKVHRVRSRSRRHVQATAPPSAI